MTVEVETPQGLRTGSSVIETKSWREIKILPDQHIRSGSMRGEAVAVDLPGGQTLFALLRGERGRHIGNLIADTLGPRDSAAREPGAPARVIPRLVLSRDAKGEPVEMSGLPLLVRFRDIRDPKSVDPVDPANLANSFGSGIKLHRVTVQSTDDPITTGIIKKLPWLPLYYKKSFAGNRFSRTSDLPDTLYLGSFSTEIEP